MTDTSNITTAALDLANMAELAVQLRVDSVRCATWFSTARFPTGQRELRSEASTKDVMPLAAMRIGGARRHRRCWKVDTTRQAGSSTRAFTTRDRDHHCYV
jgi:hypothetical protein